MSEAEASAVRRAGRYLLVAVGTVAFVLAVVPGVVPSEPIERGVELLGNDYFLLGAFGVVALALFLWMSVRRARERVTQATPPDPESVLDAPRPGGSIDRYVDGWPTLSTRAGSDESAAVRERLRATAVAVEMHERDCSRERAQERVDEGTWTDDPSAAWYLRAGEPASPSLRERVGLALRGDSWSQRGARAAARALTERAEAESADAGRSR